MWQPSTQHQDRRLSRRWCLRFPFSISLLRECTGRAAPACCSLLTQPPERCCCPTLPSSKNLSETREPFRHDISQPAAGVDFSEVPEVLVFPKSFMGEYLCDGQGPNQRVAAS